MKKLFINPEVNAVELSQTEAIMSSGEPSDNFLVNSSSGVKIDYSISDKDRDNSSRLDYWAGKNR